MKIKIFSITFVCIIVLFLIYLPHTCSKFNFVDERFKNIEPQNDYKVIFYYPFEGIASDPSNTLNKANYKIAIFSEQQLSFFLSSNPDIPEVAGPQTSENYQYTFDYQSIDLPCLHKSFVCTIEQFRNEYKDKFPEINYTVAI